MFHPADLERINQAIAYALRTKTDFNIEHRILRADGSIGHVHVRGASSMRVTSLQVSSACCRISRSGRKSGRKWAKPNAAKSSSSSSTTSSAISTTNTKSWRSPHAM
ncbi:PAS domain-containing protein [Microvirga tunisiensis]